MYTNPKWIPLTHDGGGNHIGLDFDPGALGTPGQVIRFGRDEDDKVLLAPSFSVFLDQLVTALQTATWNGEYLDWA